MQTRPDHQKQERRPRAAFSSDIGPVREKWVSSVLSRTLVSAWQPGWRKPTEPACRTPKPEREAGARAMQTRPDHQKQERRPKGGDFALYRTRQRKVGVLSFSGFASDSPEKSGCPCLCVLGSSIAPSEVSHTYQNQTRMQRLHSVYEQRKYLGNQLRSQLRPPMNHCALNETTSLSN